MNFLGLLLRGIAILPSLVQGTEALFGGNTGVQKKDAALSLVNTAINVTDAIAQKQVVDPAAFQAGLSATIDGVVACLNASIWHKAA
jgi:hypothetical protein